MSEDFENDDLGLSDDEFGEFDDDFGDFGEEPLSEPPKNGREAVVQSVSKVGSSFADEFADDKLESATEIAKNAIPDTLSEQAGIATSVKDTVKEEVSGALDQVRKEANSTFKLVKRIIPDDSERINSVVNKLGSIFGLDDETSSSSSVNKDKAQLEAITSEISSVMGEQTASSEKEQLLRDQIEQNRHKSQMELTATSASNLNAIRLFNNDIANVYYRKNLEINLKTLYVQKDQLELMKTGFDTFKNQFESIVKNTALPDIIKVRSSEAAVHKIKQKAMDGIGKALYSSSPVAAFKKNFGAKVESAKDGAISALSGLNGGLEMAASDDMGLSKEQLIASMLGGVVKEKAGKFIGKQIEKSDTGREIVSNIKRKGTDVEAYLKEAASNSESDMGNTLLNGLSELFSTRNREKYTIQQQDLNDVTLFDKRVHSSIVKVIPGLLSKIYGEIKSIRMPGTKPKDNEITYDHDSGRFLTHEQQSRKLEVKYKRKVEKTVGVSLNDVIRTITTQGGLSLDKSARDVLSQAIVTHLVVNKGARNIDALATPKFIRTLPVDLGKALKVAIKLIVKNSKSQKLEIREAGLNAIDSINRGLTSTYDNAVSVNMKSEVTELNNMGYTNIANKFNITSKDSITGEQRLDNKKLDARLVSTVGKLNTNKIDKLEDKRRSEEAAKAEETKAKESNSLKGKLKAKKPKLFYTGGYVPGYAAGGYVNNRKTLSEKIEDRKTKRTGVIKTTEAVKNNRESRYTGDGGKYTPAGVVHKGEYVLSKDNLKALLVDIRNGDSEAIKTQLSEISKSVSKSSKDGFTKLQATDAYKYLDKNTEDLQKSLSKSYKVINKHTTELANTVSGGIKSTLADSTKYFNTAFTDMKSVSTSAITSLKKDYAELGLTGMATKSYTKASEAGSKLLSDTKDTANSYKDNLLDSEAYKTARSTVDPYVSKTLDATALTILKGFNEDEVKSLKKIHKKLYSKKTWSQFIIADSVRLLGGRKVANFANGTKDKAVDTLKSVSNTVSNKAKPVTDYVSDKYDKASDKAEFYKGIAGRKVSSKIAYYGKDKNYDNILSTDETKAHRKIWKRLYKNISWEEYLETKAELNRDKFTKQDSAKEVLEKRAKHAYTKSTEGIGDDDIEYTSKLSDYTDEQRKALRSEFFSSDEYKSGDVTNYYTWLRTSKLIDTGSAKQKLTGILGSTQSRIKAFGNVKTRFNKLKDEVTDELIGKITGTGTKELTLDQESNMREEFFKTEEYKSGDVTNFDEWLESFGYKRNGTGVLGRLKKAFSLKSILKKTRKLDKAIAFGAAKLVGKGIKNTPKALFKTGKLAGKLGFGALKMTAGPALGGVASAGNTLYKSATGIGLSKDDMPVNKVKADKATAGFFNFIAKLKGGYEEYENGDKKTDAKEKRAKAKKAKEDLKAERAKAFDKDGSGTRDGSWKERLKNLGRKPKGKAVVKKDKKESGGILGMLGKYLPMLLGIVGTVVSKIGSVGKLLTSGLLSMGKLFTKSIFGLGKSIVSGVSGAVSKLSSSFMSKLGKGKPGLVSKALNGAKNLGSKALDGVKNFGSKAFSFFKNAGSKALDVGKSVISKVKSVGSAIGKKGKAIISKLKGFVGLIKNRVLKKFGKRMGMKLVAKLTAKIAARFVPVLGQALMAFTVADIGRYMIQGKSLISAVLLHFLGVDLFADDAVVKDDNGDLIKPDEPKAKEAKDEAKDLAKYNKVSKPKIDTKTKLLASSNAASSINRSNNTSFNGNKTLKDNLYKQDNGDGVIKPTKVKQGGSSNPKSTPMAKGGLYKSDGGFNNLIVPKGVRVDGFQPALAENLASMANEYYSMTGKKIPINSGYRSYEDQLALKKKYGSKAASPGKSTHEFGLAFDTNTSTANELDKLGLMKKYGLTRPVGKETWHVESAGIQNDINKSKQDPEYANNMIASAIGAGGEGWGTVKSARKYSRNKKYQEKLVTLRSFLNTDEPVNNTDASKDKVIPKVKHKTNTITSKPSSKKPNSKESIKPTNNKLTDIADIEKGVKTTTGSRGRHTANRAVKQNNVAVDKDTKVMLDKYQQEISANTAKTAVATAESVNVQKQMVDILGTISKRLDGGLDISNLDSIPQPNIVVNKETVPVVNQPRHKELPRPTIDISRKKYTS